MTIDTRSKQTYVGAGIILVRYDPEGQHRYLLLKGTTTGVWSFSKGHPEAHDKEVPLRTAVRETCEETGLVAGHDYDILGNSIRFGKRPYWIGIMRDVNTAVKLSNREHSEAVWYTWEEIADLSTNIDVRCWVKTAEQERGGPRIQVHGDLGCVREDPGRQLEVVPHLMRVEPSAHLT